MTDYIERDRLMSEIEKSVEAAVQDGNLVVADAFETMRDLVYAFPAADVRPVVRGRWVDEPDSNRMCACSLCGQWITKELSDCFNYCPNCGADMNIKPSETLVSYIPIAEETEV